MADAHRKQHLPRSPQHFVLVTIGAVRCPVSDTMHTVGGMLSATQPTHLSVHWHCYTKVRLYRLDPCLAGQCRLRIFFGLGKHLLHLRYAVPERRTHQKDPCAPRTCTHAARVAVDLCTAPCHMMAGGQQHMLLFMHMCSPCCAWTAAVERQLLYQRCAQHTGAQRQLLHQRAAQHAGYAH